MIGWWLLTGLIAGASIDDDDLARRATDRVRSMNRSEVDLWLDHSTWERAWIIERGHYRVRSTRPLKSVVQIADDLESMLGFFQSVLGRDVPPDTRFNVWITPTLDTYNQQGGGINDDATAYHTSSLGSFFGEELDGSPVITYDPGDDRMLRLWFTHSAVHQYLASAFNQRPPTWLDEGLASYFTQYWNPVYGDRSRRVARQMRDRGELVSVANLLNLRYQAYDELRFHHSGALFVFLFDVYEQTRTQVDPDTGEIIQAPFRDAVREAVTGNQRPVTELLQRNQRDIDQAFDAYLAEE